MIVASCSPRTHEPLFQETIREAGLNRYLFEMANIRDQCSWVHMNQKEEATSKARDLVRMAVANARLIHPLEELTKSVTKRGPGHRGRPVRHDRGPGPGRAGFRGRSGGKGRGAWAGTSAA